MAQGDTGVAFLKNKGEPQAVEFPGGDCDLNVTSEQQDRAPGKFCLWGPLGGPLGKLFRDAVTQVVHHCGPPGGPGTSIPVRVPGDFPASLA